MSDAPSSFKSEASKIEGRHSKNGIHTHRYQARNEARSRTLASSLPWYLKIALLKSRSAVNRVCNPTYQTNEYEHGGEYGS
jgi:hypothetical protein